MTTEMKIVMFTDQVNSTNKMAQRTHDEIERISQEQKRLTMEATALCRGTIIKDTGDGHIIEFLSCSDAVRCGFLIQQSIGSRNQSQADPRQNFELHIGIDLGEAVVLADGDLRANSANLAARVCSECPPGEVYFTEKVKVELSQRDVMIESVGSLQLKGIQEEVAAYRLLDWRGGHVTSPNPFVFRDGILHPDFFFDRENEQHRLKDFLSKQAKCQIVGPPRTGKTSLLLQVKNLAPSWRKNVIVAYLDLYLITHTTIEGWLKSASDQFRINSTPRTLTEFAEGISDMIGRRDLHPVLCLDQFEQLTTRRTIFDSDFFKNLRAIGSGGMSIITASQKRLSELTDPGDPSSPFYNVFSLLRIGAFSQEDAEDFVNIWRPGIPPFVPEERTAILKFAKRHPLALQVACYYVLEAKLSGNTIPAAIREARDEMRGLLRNGW